MKGLLLVVLVALLAVGCVHVYPMEIEGHRVSQVRTYDLIGPSTVGFYEDVDGKLRVYQDSAGNVFGEVAQAIGTGYAGERVGDGLKNQEAEQTNIKNEATGGKGGAATGGEAAGGSATGGSAYGGEANSVSGAAAGAISNSSATGFRGYKPASKPSVKPPTKPATKPASTNQSVSVRNTINP